MPSEEETSKKIFVAKYYQTRQRIFYDSKSAMLRQP